MRKLHRNPPLMAVVLAFLAACAGGAGVGSPSPTPSEEAPRTTAPPATKSVPTPTTSAAPSPSPTAEPVDELTKYEDLEYGPVLPGNRLDLYVPRNSGDALLPLIIWHSGSGWTSDDIKAGGDEVAAVEEFTARGYAVASMNIRSSSTARFPAQGFDVRAAIRYLRQNASTYGIDPDRFAFMGNSSGGWATAFAATTADVLELDGEQDVNGISSAISVAVPFFAPTDFLSMDAFATENDLPMSDEYPFDEPDSPVGLLVHCQGEGSAEGPLHVPSLVSIQDCPDEAEKADPASYVDADEVPMWLFHGLRDPIVPYNQSQLLYEATTSAGSEARFTLVQRAGHWVGEIVGADDATTWATDADGHETETAGSAPSWDEIEQFIAAHLGGP